MKRKNKKNYTLWIIILLAVLIVMIALLYVFEKDQSEGSIKSIGDAIWYVIVTMTTVGYGDITPVSIGGRIIGGIFLISSMGILVALLGTAVRFITSESVPEFKLRFNKDKNWYYFCGYSEEADVLARDIIQKDGDALIIYGIGQDRDHELPDYPCIFVHESPARAVKLKGKHGSRCKIFYLKEDDYRRSALLIELGKLEADVYVRTTIGPSNDSKNLHFYHVYDCCARGYWRNRPLIRSERNIVIIGFGHYGQAILERAILTNIISTTEHVVYHVFGNGDEFRIVHNKLDRVISINEVSDSKDSILFHTEKWEECRELLESASRIILCSDGEENVWGDYWKMTQFYNTIGRIDIRSNRNRKSFNVFGTFEDVFSVKQIIREKLNYVAYAMNEQYVLEKPEKAIQWEDLSASLQMSKIAIADHLNAKVRIIMDDDSLTNISSKNMVRASDEYYKQIKNPERREQLRKIEQLRWVRYYAYYNWGYGENWDNINKNNPLMVPYEELTEEQKKSFDKAWELVGIVAPKLKEYEGK